MSQLGPIFAVVWAVLNWALLILVLLALGAWAMGRIQVKFTDSRSAGSRARRRTRREIRAEKVRMNTENGRAFEAKLAKSFRATGWHVEETPSSGDFGVDLIITKEDQRVAVQAKHHRKPVTGKAVDAVYGGKDYYVCQRAILIAPGGVTDLARVKADKIGVGIWGKQELAGLYQDAAGALAMK